VTADLQAYGWERDTRGIWHQTQPHLTIVPDPKPKKPRKRYEVKVPCACGALMWKGASRCRSCFLASITAPTPRRKTHASDLGVDELMTVLARTLMATPAPPLPVHLCDCGSLLRLDEALCPECRAWAERNAAVWSWSA